MKPSEEQAVEAVEGLFDQFSSVSINQLGPTEHSEGYEYQVDFEISYPNGTDISDIAGRHVPIGGPFQWLKVISGMNETGPTEMEGTVRCYYHED